MKTSLFLKVAVMALPLLMASCASHKNKVEEQKPVVQIAPENKSFLDKVNDNKVKASDFITSKLKFTVEVGSQHVTLTGNLKMKRDDVIRLQLMAFGFVEAARIEFTKDYVLIMDRINKQYMKAIYADIEFLRNSGINFYTLQALFWDELFMPNHVTISAEDLQKFTASLGTDDAVIKFKHNDRMTYSWLVGQTDNIIKMANIQYRGTEQSTQLNWDYLAFEMLKNNDPKPFPTNMNVSLRTTPKEGAEKEVKVGIKLNYLDDESDWETRTEISNKYREVSVEDILKRFMSI
jgi:hypothetical protein